MRYLVFQETDITLPLPSVSLTVTPWECPVISGFMAGTKGFLGRSSHSWTPQWNIVSLFCSWRQLELSEGIKASYPDWSCVMCHCLALWGMCMCLWGRRKGSAHMMVWMGFWGSQRQMVKSIFLTVPLKDFCSSASRHSSVSCSTKFQSMFV